MDFAISIGPHIPQWLAFAIVGTFAATLLHLVEKFLREAKANKRNSSRRRS